MNTTFVGAVVYKTAHMLRFGVEQLKKKTAYFSGVKITTGGYFFIISSQNLIY